MTSVQHPLFGALPSEATPQVSPTPSAQTGQGSAFLSFLNKLAPRNETPPTAQFQPTTRASLPLQAAVYIDAAPAPALANGINTSPAAASVAVLPGNTQDEVIALPSITSSDRLTERPVFEGLAPGSETPEQADVASELRPFRARFSERFGYAREFASRLSQGSLRNVERPVFPHPYTTQPIQTAELNTPDAAPSINNLPGSEVGLLPETVSIQPAESDPPVINADFAEQFRLPDRLEGLPIERFPGNDRIAPNPLAAPTQPAVSPGFAPAEGVTPANRDERSLAGISPETPVERYAERDLVAPAPAAPEHPIETSGGVAEPTTASEPSPAAAEQQSASESSSQVTPTVDAPVEADTSQADPVSDRSRPSESSPIQVYDNTQQLNVNTAAPIPSGNSDEPPLVQPASDDGVPQPAALSGTVQSEVARETSKAAADKPAVSNTNLDTSVAISSTGQVAPSDPTTIVSIDLSEPAPATPAQAQSSSEVAIPADQLVERQAQSLPTDPVLERPAIGPAGVTETAAQFVSGELTSETASLQTDRTTSASTQAIGTTAPSSVSTAAPAPVTALTPTPPGTVPVVAPQEIVNIVNERLNTGTADDRQIVVQLDPPELGRVSIDFKFDASGLQSVIVTGESAEAVKQLRVLHHELVNALEQQGLSSDDLVYQQNTPDRQQSQQQKLQAQTFDQYPSLDEGEQSAIAEPANRASPPTPSSQDGLDIRV